MKRKSVSAAIRMLVALGVSIVPQTIKADDFYKGKNLTFLVGYVPGGGNDIYMRMLARHIGRHIPGEPTVVPQNMPGAGSLVMMNYLYNIAARDGTVIGIGRPELLLEPLFGNDNAKFIPENFGWVGSPTKDPVATCVTWGDSSVVSFDDAKRKEVLLAGLGAGTLSDYYPRVLNATISTRFKVLLGYADSGAAGLAMERKEIEGVCGLSLATIRATRPDWLAKKQVNVIGVFSTKRAQDLPDAKTVYEYADSEPTRQMFNLAFGVNYVDRPVMTPPNLPPERMTILRKALQDTLKDPVYIADVRRANLDLNPAEAEEIESAVARLLATPKEIIQQLKTIREAN